MDLLDRLLALVRSPEFPTKLEVQAGIATQLGALRGALPDEDWRLAAKEAATALGITVERWEAITRLPSEQDRRRALAVSGWSPRPRGCGEGLYPSTGWLGTYVDSYCTRSEIDIGWNFWCGVAVLGAAMRRNLYMDRGAYYLWPNHYLFLVGPSGSHKSTAMDHALPILSDLNRLVQLDPSTRLCQVEVLPSKVTPESLEDDLHEMDPGVAMLFNDEAANILGKEVKGSDRLVHRLTDLYGCPGSRRYGTRTHGKRQLRNLYLTCLFGSTPEWIADMAHETISGGFIARCIHLYRDYPAQADPFPEPLDPVVRVELAKLLVPWAVGGTVQAHLTDEAAKWFDTWYRALHASIRRGDTPGDELTSYLVRKQDHLLKLAMLLSVSELAGGPHGEDLLVGVEQLELSNQLLTHEEDRMPSAFDAIGSHPDAKNSSYLLGHVSRNPGIGHSQLYNKCKLRIGSGREFSRLVDDLVLAGQVRVEMEKGTKHGRPARHYYPIWG